MISFLISTLKIIILLGFLVFIHEFGHFSVAKLCKVKVNEFAIGFGPAILKIKGKETRYVLRLLPLGGFVSMEGEDSKSEDERAFNKVKIRKRIAIVAAGGLVNICFALIAYLGLQAIYPNNITTEVDYALPGYAAENVNIQQNDIIEKINGKKVYTQSDISKLVSESEGKELVLTINRNGNKMEQKIIPTEYLYNCTGFCLESEYDTTIKAFDKTSVENQGFKVGDKIIEIDGQKIENDSKKLSELLQDTEKDTFELLILRKGKNINISVTPIKKMKYMLGINFKKADKNLKNNLYYAAIETKDFSFSIIDNIKEIVSGKVSKDDFMGPVGISSAVSKTNGIKEFIYMLALISLSLGVTNLLPFPPLDGGKIVFLIIEAIRKKPLKEEIEAGIQMVGFSILIILAIFVTYNDILRL